MKPLRILSYVFANHHTGLGHFHRSLALARTARERGHTVFVASDRKPLDNLTWINTRYNHQLSLEQALGLTNPDWLIVDVPDPLPTWIREAAKCKVCALNGIGYNQNEEGIDLRIIQSVVDVSLPGTQDKVPTLKGLEYIILRPELKNYRGMVRGTDWFVFGGGVDNLNLLSRFSATCPGWFAMLVTTPMGRVPPIVSPTQTVIQANGESSEMFEWMAGSKAACVAMGMCVPELVYLRIPTFVLSLTPLHLRFAMGMHNAGLIKAWLTVGLPSKDELRAFLEQDFELPKETGLDLLGGQRVMEAIEGY